MQVLRVPPYPLTTTWTLPNASYEYVVYVEDLVDHSVEETTMFSDANGKLVYELPQSKIQFDRKFLIRFYDTAHENILYEENLDVVRPYVNPYTYGGSTTSEIAEYERLELYARAIIDSHITDGFYNEKHIVQGVGQGTDYYSIWEPLNKVLKVYENNVLVYDIDTPESNLIEYRLTLDKSAIERVITDTYNRVEQGLMSTLPAYGDLGHYGPERYVDFPKGYDYSFVLDVGYKTVPADVELATKLLMEDIQCGKLDYYSKYVSAYNTDQFRVQFDKRMLEGTGNQIVDKILDKYSITITKPGIL
jgi:hypothetical protein